MTVEYSAIYEDRDIRNYLSEKFLIEESDFSSTSQKTFVMEGPKMARAMKEFSSKFGIALSGTPLSFFNYYRLAWSERIANIILFLFCLTLGGLATHYFILIFLPDYVVPRWRNPMRLLSDKIMFWPIIFGVWVFVVSILLLNKFWIFHFPIFSTRSTSACELLEVARIKKWPADFFLLKRS